MHLFQRWWERTRHFPQRADQLVQPTARPRKLRPIGRPELFEPRLLLAINPIVVNSSVNNNSPATADALGVTPDNAVLAVGRLASGDRDYFSFAAPAGAKVWAYVDTGGPRNLAGSSRDSFLTLFGTDGVTVIESDDDEGSSNGGDDSEESSAGSVIAGRTLSAAGTYYLMVNEYGDDGTLDPYKLFVSITTTAAAPEGSGANNLAFGAVPIAGATPVRSGAISPAGDADFYSFTAVAGDQVFIAVDGNPERDGSSTDVSVSLIGPNGVSAINPTATDSGTTAEGTNFRLITGGTYFVRIQGASGSVTGTYHLLVQVGQAAQYLSEKTGDNNSPGTAQPLDASSPVIVVGNLPIGDTDVFSFTAPANSRVWAFVETGGIRNVFGSSRDSSLLLVGTDGVTTISSNDDGATGSGDDDSVETSESSGIAAQQLSAAGTYFLRVESFGRAFEIDPYRLFVFVTADPVSNEVERNDTFDVANPIGGTAGPTKRGTFTSQDDVDYYSISLRPGDILWFAVSASFDPISPPAQRLFRTSIIAPNATTTLITLDGVGGQLSMASFRAVVAGTYFIRVAAQFGFSGSLLDYQLMANVIASANTAPTLNTSGSPYAILGVGSRQSTEMRQGVLVSEILARSAGGNPISDPDAGAQTGIAVTFYNGAFGGFEYTLVTSNPAESDWIDMLAGGVVSDANSLLLPPTARVRFKTTLTPHHDTAPIFLPVGSKLDEGLRFRAWDRTTGVAGGRANVTVSGGTTAFSTAAESVAVYFEARLFRHFNRNASLNVYTLEAEFNALSGGAAFEDRSTSAYTGFTVLLSPVPELGTVPLYRMYYGVQFNTNGTEIDMGYRYLTSNLAEAQFLEGLGPADKRPARQGAYFRELGVSAGTAILGYLFTSAQPGTQQLVQVYRTDIVQKPTRPPGTPEGSTPTSFTPQENGDHVYTTNTAFETTKPGTWRVESPRGFARPLSPTPPPAIAPAEQEGAPPRSRVDFAVPAAVSVSVPSLPTVDLIASSGDTLLAGLVVWPGTGLSSVDAANSSGASDPDPAWKPLPNGSCDDGQSEVTDDLFADLDELAPILIRN